jgi:hypothetical protein
MLKVAELLAQLDEPEHRALANSLGSGLMNARLAAQCLTDPTPQTPDVAQLLAYLSDAICQLEAARELVRQRA